MTDREGTVDVDIYIEKGNFIPGVIERLMGRYRVHGPVKNGRFHEFSLLQERGGG